MTPLTWLGLAALVAVVALFVLERSRQHRLEFLVRLIVVGADRPLEAFEIRERLRRLHEEVVSPHELRGACQRLVRRGAIAHADGPNGYERFQAVPRRGPGA